jgi:predicted MFS family arabinose efflux permease
MFAPAFFTGSLIKRFGVIPIMVVGALMDALAVMVSLSGTDMVHFTVALFAVGIGWNFLFISATSLLTETYKFEERGKVQGANDFIVNAGVTVSAFSAGVVNHQWGWSVANYIVVPCIATIFLLLIWLKFTQRATAGAAASPA